jgi:hypothetical protein
MSEENIKRIPIKDLRQEEGASELATSPEMQPYLRLIKGRTVRSGHDSAPGRNRRLTA